MIQYDIYHHLLYKEEREKPLQERNGSWGVFHFRKSPTGPS